MRQAGKHPKLMLQTELLKKKPSRAGQTEFQAIRTSLLVLATDKFLNSYKVLIGKSYL
jgi:hypothetical protein